MGTDDRVTPDLMDDLPDDFRAAFKPELDPGERLLWAAWGEEFVERYPRRSLALSFLAAAFFALSLVFLLYYTHAPGRFAPTEASSILATATVSGTVALVVAALRIATGLRPPQRAAYALTDRRAILRLAAAGGAIEVRSLPRGALRMIQRIERPDGSGDLLFGPDPSVEGEPAPGFRGIADVRHVEGLVRRTLIDPAAPLG